jgi:hypothetical protein
LRRIKKLMSVAERFNEIITLEPKIKLLGVLKDGNRDVKFNDPDKNLDDNTTNIILIQTPHIVEIGERFSNELGKLEYISFEYDKLKLFDLPVKDEIVAFVTTKDVDNEEVVKTVSGTILKSEKGKILDDYNYSANGNYDDLWQNYMLNCIDFMKEFTITSIHTNEKMLISFWQKFNK